MNMNKRSQSQTSEPASGSQAWPNFKKAIVGIGAIALVALLADVLGLVAFLGGDTPRVETPVISPDSLIFHKYDHPINVISVENDSNFIDESSYICDFTGRAIISAAQSAGKRKEMAGLIKAVIYFCDNKNTLAYEYICRYELPPSGVDPVAFYTLKGKIILFEHNYDLAYQYLLKAYYIDKQSPHRDWRTLRELTFAYGQLKMSGYSLKDIKGIKLINSNIIYEVGSRKIKAYAGWMPVNQSPSEEDKALIQFIHEFGLDELAYPRK